MNIKQSFFKLYWKVLLVNNFYLYTDTFVQIYIANNVAIFFNQAINGQPQLLLKGAAKFIIILFGLIILQYCISSYVALIKTRKKFRFKEIIFKGFLNNSFENIENITSGEILTRFEKDVDAIASVLDDSFCIVCSSIISIITYFIYLYKINAVLSIVIFALGCLPFIPPFLLRNMYTKAFNNYYKIEEKLVGFIKEIVNGFEFVKLNNIYIYAENKYHQLQAENGKWSMDIEKAASFEKSMNAAIVNISKFSTYGFLGYYVFKGIINPADVVQFLMISNRIFSNLQNIFDQYDNYRELKVSLDRIKSILSIEISDDNLNYSTIDGFKSIKLENINFSYNEDKKLLNDININISKGDKIAVLGPNGAGKSTLIKIIMGLYSKYTGKIYINDIPLKQVNLKNYQGYISWVPQEQSFFYGDVIDNVKLLNCKNNKKLNGFIDLFDLKSNLLKSSSCNNLSGGERQKLSLIRGMMKDSEVVILDEPTNYLDSKGIETLKEIIKKSKKTIIVITHNSQLLDVFDNIYTIT